MLVNIKSLTIHYCSNFDQGSSTKDDKAFFLNFRLIYMEHHQIFANKVSKIKSILSINILHVSEILCCFGSNLIYSNSMSTKIGSNDCKCFNLIYSTLNR